MFDKKKIDEIIDKVDIVEIVSKYVRLEKKGNNLVGLCPFHQEKTPSFTVSPDKKIATCFSCGNGGNVIGFLSKIENINFYKACEKICDEYGIQYNKRVNPHENLFIPLRLANDFYKYLLNNSNSGIYAKEYLLKRGLSDETIKYFNIGYAPSNNIIVDLLKDNNIDLKLASDLNLINEYENKYYDFFKNRIIFPIYNEFNEVVAFSGRTFEDNNEPKYINSAESLIFKKNNVLFNLNNAKKEIKSQDLVYIFEGFMDVISSYQAGIKNSVGLMGTALTINHRNLLTKYTKNIVLVLDGDKAGVQATNKAINILKENCNVYVVTLKDNLDPDEYIKKYGNESFINYLDKNKKDIYEHFYSFKLSTVNKDNLLEIDNFKNTIFSFLKSINSNLIKVKILDQLSQDLGVDIEVLKSDFNNIQYKNNISYNSRKEKESNTFDSNNNEIEKENDYNDNNFLISIENHLINFCINNSNSIEIIDNEISITFEPDPILSKIRSELIEFIKENKEYNESSFIGKLNEEQKNRFNKLTKFNNPNIYTSELLTKIIGFIDLYYDKEIANIEKMKERKKLMEEFRKLQIERND